jgi:hypothetical protein
MMAMPGQVSAPPPDEELDELPALEELAALDEVAPVDDVDDVDVVDDVDDVDEAPPDDALDAPLPPPPSFEVPVAN